VKYRERILSLLTLPTRFAKFYLFLLLFLGLSFLSIYFVYKKIGGNSFAFDKQLISFDFLTYIVILLFLYFLFDGLRLYFVLRSINEKVPFKDIFKLVFINIFISNVTPLATGGGFVQIFYLTKNGVPMGKASAATLIRTFLAVIFLFISAPLIIIFAKSGQFASFLTDNIYTYIFIILALYFLAFYVVVFKKRYICCIVYIFLRLLRKMHFISHRRFRRYKFKSIKQIILFSKSLAWFLKGDIKFVASSIFFTFMFLMSLFSFSAIILWELSYAVGYFDIVGLQVVITFLMYFAPTPGASGVAEGAYSVLFSKFVSQNDITLVTLSWRFFTIYIGVFIGMIVLYWDLFRKGKKR